MTQQDSMTPAKGPGGRRRGRGARERVLETATGLFRERGINSTGMEELSAAARVSKRTIYQHFGSKGELIAEYLRELDVVPQAESGDAAPASRESLLAAFEAALTPEESPLCPFIGAAVEIADPADPARDVVRHYKGEVAAHLSRIARDAGATEPEVLGESLALLLDGSSVRTRATGVDAKPTAIAIAKTLIWAALPAAVVE